MEKQRLHQITLYILNDRSLDHKVLEIHRRISRASRNIFKYEMKRLYQDRLRFPRNFNGVIFKNVLPPYVFLITHNVIYFCNVLRIFKYTQNKNYVGSNAGSQL